MPDRLARLALPAAFAALLALGACSGGSENNLAEIDNALLANGADPALTSALEDQILVDPNLVQQAHPNTVRPPEAPMQAQYPAGSAAEGAGQAGRAGGGASVAPASLSANGCGVPFDYGAQWAQRLPREFPLYPGGRLTEAAGSDSGDCRMRVVTFRTADAYARVLDHYRALASRAGFSAEHQVRGGDHVLGGVNPSTDGAFYLIVTPLARGSDVALIVNRGA
ncbi:hypothetical protein [Sphingosinicella terrae]|uniref:hypothetical protein n=1 Tax=Sphingosinicella terrae TaxID=2172047 RepID=UPI000E0D89BE|nr:hypothetical protein [Sphingosinicella terrae]